MAGATLYTVIVADDEDELREAVCTMIPWEELGFRLLERQKGARSVEPTQEGRAFTPVAEHWLALWEEARSIPQREENQVFRVASVGSVSTYILAPVLQRFLLDGTSSLTFHQYHSVFHSDYVV